MQVLEGGNLKPLIEHMNGQQFTWLQAFVLGKAPEVRAAEAAPLADFLAGCSQQGYKYMPAFYGCLAPYLPVGLSSTSQPSIWHWVSSVPMHHYLHAACSCASP